MNNIVSSSSEKEITPSSSSMPSAPHITHSTFHDKNLVLKCRYGDEIHRSALLKDSSNEGELTYNELCIMMKRIFKSKLASVSSEQLVLKYIDNGRINHSNTCISFLSPFHYSFLFSLLLDGDLVNLENDTDVIQALSISNVLKITVFGNL